MDLVANSKLQFQYHHVSQTKSEPESPTPSLCLLCLPMDSQLRTSSTVKQRQFLIAWDRAMSDTDSHARKDLFPSACSFFSIFTWESRSGCMSTFLSRREMKINLSLQYPGNITLRHGHNVLDVWSIKPRFLHVKRKKNCAPLNSCTKRTRMMWTD